MGRLRKRKRLERTPLETSPSTSRRARLDGSKGNKRARNQALTRIYSQGAPEYRRRMKKHSIWTVDLIDLLKLWVSDLVAFFETALMFLVLSLPVVISALVLWWLV